MNISEEEEPILEVKSFDNQMKGYSELHPSLPQPPFSLCMVGPKGAGKSTVILRLIYGNQKPKNYKKDDKHYRFYRKILLRYMYSAQPGASIVRPNDVKYQMLKFLKTLKNIMKL